VILVYLGFLHAQEMMHCGNPFRSGNEWQDFVLGHSDMVPEGACSTRLQTNAAPIWAMVRSLELRWMSGGPGSDCMTSAKRTVVCLTLNCRRQC
jgi:hypothetical protein